jgi:hypothetical protein
MCDSFKDFIGAAGAYDADRAIAEYPAEYALIDIDSFDFI